MKKIISFINAKPKRRMVITLATFALIFNLIALGTMGYFQIGEVAYPAQNVLTFSKYKGSDTPKYFYQDLEKVAEKDKLTLFKSVVDSKNQVKGYVFGYNRAAYQNNSAYTLDDNTILQSSPLGTYYVAGNLSTKTKADFSAMKMTYTVRGTGWFIIGLYLLAGWSIITFSFWTLMIIFAMALYAVKLAGERAAVIQKSLGVFKKNFFRNLFFELGMMALSMIFIGLLVSVVQGYFGTMLVMGYFAVILPVLLIQILCLVLINLLFALNIRFSKILDILKNKKRGALANYIWLAGILIGIVVFSNEVVAVNKGFPALLSQGKIMSIWQQESGYSLITWNYGWIVMSPTDPQLEIGTPPDFYHFVTQFGKDGMIYAGSYNVPQVVKPGATAADPKGISVPVPSDVSDHLWEVTPSLVEKQASIYPKSHYAVVDSSPVVIYVPQRYMKDLEIIKYAAFDKAQGVIPLSDMTVVTVPNNISTFMFNSFIAQGLSSTVVENGILIQIDLSQFPDGPPGTAVGVITDKYPNHSGRNDEASNMAQFAIFQQSDILANAQTTGLSQYIDSFVNVNQSLVIQKNQLQTEFISAIILLITLFIVQAFVIYEFIRVRLTGAAKKLSVYQLLGENIYILTLSYQIVLGVGIVLAVLLGIFISGNFVIPFLLGLIYLVEMFGLTFLATRRIKNEVATLLKGDFGVL